MYNKIFYVSLILLFSFNDFVKSQEKIDTCKCSYLCWPKEISNLNENEILGFLKSINADCKNNAEFSEYSNEMLFKILTLNHQVFINTIDNFQYDLDIEQILKYFRNPYADTINVIKFYDDLKNSGINSDIRNRMIESLKIGIEKRNKH